MVTKILNASKASVNILILSPNDTVRHLFENAGFNHIKTVRQNFDEALKIITVDHCDVVVIDDIFLDEDTVDFIKAVRSGKHGKNIFLPIITLISDARSELARNAINVGADDVVIKPLSVNDINRRMTALLNRDLLYVVNANYIGPNRHSAERTDAARDSLISVPNALRMKADGFLESNTRITKLIQEASRDISNRSATLDGEIIQSLINEVVANPEEAGPTLSQLNPLVHSFAQKLEQTDFHHISELCNILMDILSVIVGSKVTQDIEILSLVGQALKLSFENSSKSNAAASEIIALIKQRVFAGS